MIFIDFLESGVRRLVVNTGKMLAVVAAITGVGGFLVAFVDGVAESIDTAFATVNVSIDWVAGWLPWGFINTFVPVPEMVVFLKLYLTVATIVIVKRWILKFIPFM